MTPKLFIIADVLLVIVGAVYFYGKLDRHQCEAVIAKYDYGRKFPELDNPERARFVDCYYIICGVKLSG